MKFEYKQLILQDTEVIGDSKLNEYGQEGWELVSSFQVEKRFGLRHFYIFKREIE